MSPSSSHPHHSKFVSPTPSKQEAHQVVGVAAVAKAVSAQALDDEADTLVVVELGRSMREEGSRGSRFAFGCPYLVCLLEPDDD